MKLNTSQILKIWEVYQQYDSLYIISHKEHKNKIIEDTSLKSIIENLKEFGINFEDTKALKKKLKSLKDTYRVERRKVVISERSGKSTDDIYVPKLEWYTQADAFLRPHVEIREMTDNLTLDASTENAAGEVLDSDEEANEGNEAQQMGEPSAKKRKTVQADQSNLNTKSSKTSASAQKTLPTSGSKSKISNKKNCNGGSSFQTDEFLLRLEAVRQEARQKKEEKHSCDLFGEQVAADLKAFSELDQLRIKCEIQGVLLKFKASAMNVVFVEDESQF